MSSEEELECDNKEIVQKPSKVVTKANLAKKMLKKNIQANKKTTFDDDGNSVDDGTIYKVSKEGQMYEKDDEEQISGINFEKAKSILKAEDQFDKQKEKVRIKELHKEKKRKEKEAKNKRKKEDIEKDSNDEVNRSTKSTYHNFHTCRRSMHPHFSNF